MVDNQPLLSSPFQGEGIVTPFPQFLIITFSHFLNSHNMKSMSKSELADRAGVSVNTLMNWCKPFRKELTAMGMLPNAKVLPPRIVKFITDKFCIDV